MSNSVNLALDVTKTGIQNPLIKVRQGDGGFETLHTTVTSNGEPLDLQGWTITFMGTTAGNHKIVDGNVKIIEAPNGIFDYTPSKAWGIDIGEFKIAYFKFVKGDGSASSANFRVSVIEAVDLTQEEAQNYISVVDATIAEINQHLTGSLARVTQSIADANNNADTVARNVAALGNRVDDYNNKLTAVKVGGRNYLLNSSGDTLSGWGNSDNIWSITSDPTRGNVFTATPTTTWTGGGLNAMYEDVNTKTIGQQVTVSFWAKSTVSGAKLHSEPKGGSNEFNTNLTTNWAKYSYTISSFSGTIYFMAVDAGTTYYIDDIKLETGNIATDWTPAPEEVPSNDAQLVHKTGTETIAGDKTFTGKVTANNLVSNNVPVNLTKTTTSNMWFGSTLIASRTGNVVTIVNDKQDGGTIGDTSVSLEAIPAGYRPSTVSFYPVMYGSSLKGGLQINTNGTFTARGTINGQYQVTATYITGDAWPV